MYFNCFIFVWIGWLAMMTTCNLQEDPKLKLNDFIEESPDVWFKMAKILFTPFGVETEIQKSAYLWQSVSASNRTHSCHSWNVRSRIIYLNQLKLNYPSHQAKQVNYGKYEAYINLGSVHKPRCSVKGGVLNTMLNQMRGGE